MDSARSPFAEIFRRLYELKNAIRNRGGDLAMLHGKWILHATGPDVGRIHSKGRRTENRSPAAGWALAISDRQSVGTQGLTSPVWRCIRWALQHATEATDSSGN